MILEGRDDYCEQLLLSCECGELGRGLYLTVFKDEPGIYVNYQLGRRSFWNRLKRALKYLFDNEMWIDDMIVSKKDLKKVRKLIDKQLKYG